MAERLGVGRQLPMMAALALVLALALLYGCAGGGQGLEGEPAGEGALPVDGLLLKNAAAPYVAQYRVADASGETEKSVYRMGQKMRVDVGSGLYGKVSLYLVNGRAYSCTDSGQGGRCFDITDKMADAEPQLGFQDGPPNEAVFERKVEIGGTEGDCYLLQSGIMGQRRLCYAAGGVLAYDELNSSENSTRTEYAVRISYAAKESDFALPYPVFTPPS